MVEPRVDILIEGFVDEGRLERDGLARYRPTISLVRAGSIIAIIDPGTVERQDEIVNALQRHEVAATNVTHVILTHHHLDHHRNAGMFPDIPVIDGWATWTGVDFSTDTPEVAKGVKIQKTPGHTYDSLTVFVNTGDGVVAICGDLMWWVDDSMSDKYAEDAEALARSRVDVLSRAEFVIPGHGPGFVVLK